MGRHLILIHGAFAGPWCMEPFADHLSRNGLTCHTPALRYHGDDPKGEPDPRLKDVGIADYADDIAELAGTLDSKPVILGHAVGGLVAQLVAARGLASGIILINPNTPWGVLPETDGQRAVARGLMEAGAFWNGPMRVQFDLIAPFAFNRMPPEQQHEVFDRLGPESGRVMFEMFFWMFDDRHAIRVDFDQVTCPVLILSGADDQAVPSFTGRELAARYAARATWQEVPDRAHFMFLEPGWQSVADRCAAWMGEHALR